MNVKILLGIVIWLYGLLVFKWVWLFVFYFIVGSVGFFFILMVISCLYWVWFFIYVVIYGVVLFSDIIGWCSIMFKMGLVYIINSGNLVIMLIDYECLGIIEMCVFILLVVFYLVY